MSLVSLLAFTVYAAETVISPLPTDEVTLPVTEVKPQVSFGQLVKASLPAVLGETTAATPAAAPTPVAPRTRKSHFTIAVIGDSMVDTLGPNLPDLKARLSGSFPGVSFTLLNYGVGATNIDFGLERLTHDYDYLGKHIPSLISQQPEIVVIESFGYNPYSIIDGALDKHWLALAQIVTTLKAQAPGTRVVVATTIAPNNKTFGDGAAGVSFDPAGKLALTSTIKKYLENAVRFAQSQQLPLADSYHASLDTSGNGAETYINQGDHIHPSAAGRALFAQKVAQAIVGNRLLE